jgi:hypothetical protein
VLASSSRAGNNLHNETATIGQLRRAGNLAR